MQYEIVVLSYMYTRFIMAFCRRNWRYSPVLRLFHVDAADSHLLYHVVALFKLLTIEPSRLLPL